MKILEMKNITKSFFGNKVLNDVFFSVKKGEVHALLGENGAGKSTLMNILGGVYTLEEGEIFFDDQKLTDMNTRKASEAGIAFVHQELNLFNDLRVYENIFIGNEILNRFRKVNNKEMIKQSEKLFNDLGISLDPTEVVENLTVAEKQILEIVKALRADSKLIILDEPTTALNNEEINLLFETINRLKKTGTAFVFISHKMPEVFEISDTFTVLRNGLLVRSGKIKDFTPEDVTRMMVGEQYRDEDVYEKRELGDVVLQLDEINTDHLKDVSFKLRKGEIFGVTGLQGAGASELLQTIFGSVPVREGEIEVFDTKRSKHGIKRTMKMKVAMLAANRKENSVIQDLSVLENLYVSEHTLSLNRFHIKNSYERKNYETYREQLNIRARNHSIPITNLSGGNQQKVILSRWLNTEADILLLDNPTQGIDVGAKNEIYKLIVDLAKQGKTIVVNTLEISEIQKIADRCLVLYQGNIQTILDRKDITEENVMLYATDTIRVRKENGNATN